MKYIDVKTASEKWNITERRVTYLCRNGRIEGAKKEAGLWLIPSNSVKPEDGRKNKIKTLTTTIENLPLPIGVSNYIELVENYYYVDKTLMIKDFLDSRPKISLFTRPRRFGKTLTMDMLKTFFEISENDTSVYFKDKNIWNCGEKYRKEQGKYPVISVTFKDIKYSTWEQSFTAIRDVIVEEYKRHIYILDSNKCNDYDKKYFLNIINQSITEVELAGAFSNLSKMLNIHHNKPAIIIIDEYDTPIHQGFSAGYYDLVVNFMRNLLSGACKDNSNLAFGFLTGIMRVAKESIFSGLNNLAIHSILDTKFSEYFGFTKYEILSMAAYYNSSDKYEEICRWYNGYKFGNNNIFNPWSVINYFYNSCKPKAYWQSTGDNSIIKQLIENSNNETYDNLYTLLQGNVISSYIDSSVIYPEIMSNTSTVFSFLLSAGYLKVINTDNMQDENGIYDLAIPNKEISYVYEKEILSLIPSTKNN
ncbi:MAG: AAA family ATPase [Lachnospiraceae bacterium]|nr:AAA family ATPase [Lachnospiraceae bacterium]